MRDLDRPKHVAITHEAHAHRDLWVSCAAVVFVALVIGGGLVALSAQYRSGWVAAQQGTTDKAAAIHKLMFRQ